MVDSSSVILLAFLGAISLGLSNSIIRFADKSRATKSHAFIVLVVTLITVFVIFLFSERTLPNLAALPWLILAGIFAPGLAWMFRFISMAKLGIGVSGVLLATAPFFSFTLAIFFLGEQLSFEIFLGTLFILGGIVVLLLKLSKKISLSDVWIPLAGALAIGINITAVKYAFTLSPSVLGNLLVIVATGVVVESLIVLFFKKKEVNKQKISFLHSLPPFVLSGFINGLGFFFVVSALSQGAVVLVHPIVITRMFFALFFSTFFFRQDKPTITILFAAILIFIGSFFISLT